MTRTTTTRHRSLIAVASLLVAPVLPALGETPDAKGALLKNPGFEQMQGGVPLAWRRCVGDAHVADWNEYDTEKHQAITMAVSTEEHKEGKSCILVACDRSVICGFGQKVRVAGDAVYLFSIWVKCQNLVATGEGGAITFEFDRKGEKLSFQYIDLRMLRGTKDWLRVRKLVKTPTGATEMGLCLYGLFNGSGKTWMDDAAFTRLR